MNLTRSLVLAALVTAAAVFAAPASAAMRYVQIVDGVVHGIYDADTYALYQRPACGTCEQTVADANRLTFVAVTNDAIKDGWLFDGSSFSAPADAPAPVLHPAIISKLDFILLLQGTGGVTDAQLVAAKADANLAALWVKLDLAVQVERDNAVTRTGIAALVALNYLDQTHADAVIAAWPMVP